MKKFLRPHPEQQAQYGNGCGLSARFLNVPDFIFKASCQHHDFNYERGGTLYHKVKADVDFFSHMVSDAEDSKNPLLSTFVATVYFIGVSLNPISYFVFTYGEWRSIEEILERDRLSKLN